MWWKVVFSKPCQTILQCFLAIRKISVCLLVSCNTPWGSSLQQILGDSFIKLEAYEENARCESERAVANKGQGGPAGSEVMPNGPVWEGQVHALGV